MGSSNHDLAKFGSSSASRKLHEISADIALVERYFVTKASLLLSRSLHLGYLIA